MWFACRNVSRNSNARLLIRSFCTSLDAVSSSPRRSQISSRFHERQLDGLVDKFKKQSNSYRFRRKQSVYDQTIHRLASAKRFDSIQEILEQQKQYHDISKEGFAVRLISLYGKSNMLGHARKLFDELPELKCPRGVKAFNALLTAALDSKEYEAVTKLFHELSAEMSVKPNIFSYNILIQAFCKMGSLNSAFLVLGSMEMNGVRPNLITFNLLLNGFYGVNQFADAEKIWAEMERVGCIPDIMAYNAKLRGLALQGNIEEATKLVSKLQDRGIKPDVFSFNALIKGYCNVGNSEAATKIYDELAINNCTPNRWTFETLIPCLCEKGDVDLALKLCKESISKCYISVDVVQGVVDALVRGSRMGEAKKLVKAGASKDHRYSKLKLPSVRE